MLYLSPHFSQKGLFLSGGPNIYVLSIYNLRMNPDPRFVEIGHVHTPTYNGDPYARFHNLRSPIISRNVNMPNLDEKGYQPSITFVSGQEGRYKSKTSLLKIELELKKIDWARKKLTSKNNAIIHLCSNFPYQSVFCSKTLIRIKMLIFVIVYAFYTQKFALDSSALKIYAFAL